MQIPPGRTPRRWQCLAPSMHCCVLPSFGCLRNWRCRGSGPSTHCRGLVPVEAARRWGRCGTWSRGRKNCIPGWDSSPKCCWEASSGTDRRPRDGNSFPRETVLYPLIRPYKVQRHSLEAGFGNMCMLPLLLLLWERAQPVRISASVVGLYGPLDFHRISSLPRNGFSLGQDVVTVLALSEGRDGVAAILQTNDGGAPVDAAPAAKNGRRARRSPGRAGGPVGRPAVGHMDVVRSVDRGVLSRRQRRAGRREQGRLREPIARGPRTVRVGVGTQKRRHGRILGRLGSRWASSDVVAGCRLPERAMPFAPLRYCK